ncbi:MAG: hypothetical protein R3D33_01720 [Hyphomicrobiaceae bacterium]
MAAGDSPQMIVLAVIRHLTRLQQIRAGLDAGKPGDQVMRSLRPPVHFKQQDAVAGQARRWTLARLSEALRLADRAAFQARVTSRLERELTERLLIDLTLLTKRPA